MGPQIIGTTYHFATVASCGDISDTWPAFAEQMHTYLQYVISEQTSRVRQMTRLVYLLQIVRFAKANEINCWNPDIRPILT